MATPTKLYVLHERSGLQRQGELGRGHFDSYHLGQSWSAYFALVPDRRDSVEGNTYNPSLNPTEEGQITLEEEYIHRLYLCSHLWKMQLPSYKCIVWQNAWYLMVSLDSYIAY